jgi:hypothetical protein
MSLEILIPYVSLLNCRLDTTVLVVDRKDIRRIGDIVKHHQESGWDYLSDHLPNKGTDWWIQVRSMVENFRWDLYRTPSLPTVKPHEGTLEFFEGGGNHRAMALAIRRIQEPIPVILHL